MNPWLMTMRRGGRVRQRWAVSHDWTATVTLYRRRSDALRGRGGVTCTIEAFVR